MIMKKPIYITTITALVIFTVMSACDVQNPGPIDEDALNSEEAIPGLVVGMSSDFSLGYRVTTYWGSVWADEQIHSGTFAAPTIFRTGSINSEDVDPWWGPAHRARWVAENGIERIQNILGEQYDENFYAARANLFAGYANRHIGENACYAVIDGGPAEDFTLHFDRSKEYFDEAIRIAQNVGNSELYTAALAGRASVLAARGEWTAAANDAMEVPIDFRHEAIYSLNSSRENNNWPTNTINRGEYSVYSTPWDGVDDPRLPQEEILTEGGDTATAADGNTPWVTQLKHETEADNIALSKGTEMLLIRAEMELRENQDIDAALNHINEGRDFHGLDPVDADNLEEAWEILHYERGADLWLEGRRFWDLRRWNEEDGPAHHPFLNDRDNCVPIGSEEIGSNENL